VDFSDEAALVLGDKAVDAARQIVGILRGRYGIPMYSVYVEGAKESDGWIQSSGVMICRRGYEYDWNIEEMDVRVAVTDKMANRARSSLVPVLEKL
jgi:hypothetical protein